MALISIPFTYTVGAVIVASQHNSCNSVIYSDYNGNITDANISASAAIANTKLAQIVTASTVSGAAITSLSSIPAGAGLIPIANIPVGTGASQIVQLTAATKYPAVDGSLITNIIGSISDYGTSTGTGTAKSLSALKIAYGTTTSLTVGGTFVITNLPFTSSSSYYVVCSPITNTTVQSAFATNNSASQCTLTSMSVPAGSNVNCAYNWFAIGV